MSSLADTYFRSDHAPTCNLLTCTLVNTPHPSPGSHIPSSTGLFPFQLPDNLYFLGELIKLYNKHREYI